MQAVDKRLELKFESRELECLLVVGLWCRHPVEKQRPSAGQVIQLLNFEATLPVLPWELHDPPQKQMTQQKCDSSLSS